MSLTKYRTTFFTILLITLPMLLITLPINYQSATQAKKNNEIIEVQPLVVMHEHLKTIKPFKEKVMSAGNTLENSKEFFADLFMDRSGTLHGGFIEIVVDFNWSKYFDAGEEFDELVNFADEQANAGHQVFFGPAPRTKDRGSARSGLDNVSGCKCLWVDIDSPDKELPAHQRLAEAKKLFEESKHKLDTYGLKPSYVVESGNGYHVYFVLKVFHTHPYPDWQAVQNALVSLAKGDPAVKQPAALLRFPDTFNLKDPANPKPVKIIESTRAKYELSSFKPLVVDVAKKYEERKKTVPTCIGHGKLDFTPPCIDSLLDQYRKPPMGIRHTDRQVLTIYAFHQGWPVEEAIQKMMHTTDDPQKTEQKIRNFYKTLERDPGRYRVGCKGETLLRSLVDAGVAVCDEKTCQFKRPKKAKKEQEKKKRHSAWFDLLVDIVADDSGEPRYLVKENGSPAIKENYEDAEYIYTPPPKTSLIWKIPRYSEVVKYIAGDNDQQLFNDLVEYHQNISELPSDNHYRLLAAWDMHTYLLDKFSYSPILWFYAIAGRGKSRTAKGITYVSRRGVIQTSVREAHIIRLANDHKATIFFDIMDIAKKIQRADVDDIILNRYERGPKVARVLNPEKGSFLDTKWYQLFGPTIIASNKTIDNILETRCLQIVMPETSRVFQNDVDENDALALRERLTAFRIRLMDQQMPEIDKPASGRLGDILKPIGQIVEIACSEKAWFTEFVRLEDESRRKGGYDTDEGKVVSVINDAWDKVKNGNLYHKHTLTVLNAGLSERNKMTPHRLGRITQRLGFKSYSSGSARGIFINQDLLKSLCQRYGIQHNKGGILTI